MNDSRLMTMIIVLTTISVATLALVALNNATSTESLFPLATVSAAGLIAMGLGRSRARD